MVFSSYREPGRVLESERGGWIRSVSVNSPVSPICLQKLEDGQVIFWDQRPKITRLELGAGRQLTPDCGHMCPFVTPQPETACLRTSYAVSAMPKDPQESPGDVTRLLGAWSEGDNRALEDLMPLVYSELHRIARRAWNSHSGNTLQPTELIHEAYLKLIQSAPPGFQSRNHFFAVASIAMRHILVNHALASVASKRGGGQVNLSLDEAEPVAREAAEVVALHEALRSLQEIDPRKSRVVELRYFGGLSIEETAEVLGISTITVNRDWRMARTWLVREMKRTP